MTDQIQLELYFPVALIDQKGNIKATEIFNNSNDALAYLYDSLSNDTELNEGRVYQAYKNKRLGTLVNFKKLETIEIGEPSVRWYNKWKPQIETQMDREAVNQKIKEQNL